MTISDFSLLKLTDQLTFLYEEGVYLSKRKSGKLTVILYQLQGAYIEIFYTKYRRVVHHIRFSESPDVLDPYLESIEIGSLLDSGS
jgi:hypothetical protein